MKKILVIDGNSIINRAFYGLHLLRAANGKYTNAIYGMVNMVKRQMDALQPDYAAVAFDVKAPTFRHKMYAEYKAGRRPTPPELLAQFPDAKACLQAMGIHVLSMPGWEADDIQGTVARMAAQLPEAHAYILTGDRDLLQLIDDRTTVLLAGNRDTEPYDTHAFFAKYGINPSQFVDAKALMGDSSDHIPGVPGVGEKTALKLISLCGSLEGVYRMLTAPEERSPEVARAMTDGLCRKLTEGRESARMSRELAQIVCDVPLGIGPEDLAYTGVCNDKLYELFVSLEFNAFIAKFRLHAPAAADRSDLSDAAPLSSGRAEGAAASADATVDSDAGEDGLRRSDMSPFSAMAAAIASAAAATSTLSAKKTVSPCGENESAADAAAPNDATAVPEDDGAASAGGKGTADATLQNNKAQSTLPCFLAEEIPVLRPASLSEVHFSEGVCLSVACFDEEWHLYHPAVGEVICHCADTEIAPYLDGSHPIICYDSKALWHRMRRAGITLGCVPRDVMLSAYLFRGGDGQVSVDSLCLSLLGCTREAVGEKQAAMLWTLDEVLLPRLRAMGCDELATEVEWPLALVLAEMEETGFALDREGMAAFGQELTHECDALTERIYVQAGHPFNLNSTKQLATVLFEELQLPARKKTKSGYSTDAETLEELRDAHPIVEDILDYRQVAKLNATYATGLLAAVDENGRLHTDFKQALTATGRLSSAEPNLQNIPVRTKLGERMRRYFVTKPGWVLVDADYSQIELRLLAHLSGDEKMIAAFRSGEDIHARTAADIAGIPVSEVTPEMRKRAKAINFGLMYGMGAHSLAKDLHITQKQAKEYMERYFASFPSVGAYLDGTVEAASEVGYTATLFGRRRYIPQLRATNAVERALGKRLAMNSPVQGTAADIMKMATLRAHRILREQIPEARLVMQVHDELIVETPKEKAEQTARLLCEAMENTASLSLPLSAAAGIGENWLDAKD